MWLQCKVSNVHSDVQKEQKKLISKRLKDTEYIETINIIFKCLTFLMASVPQKSAGNPVSGIKNQIYRFFCYFSMAVIICNSIRIISTLSVIKLENIGMLMITGLYSYLLIYITFYIFYVYFNASWIVDWRNSISEYKTVKQAEANISHLNKFGKRLFIYICIHNFFLSLSLMVILPLLYPEHGHLFYAFVFPVNFNSFWYVPVLILNFYCLLTEFGMGYWKCIYMYHAVKISHK